MKISPWMAAALLCWSAGAGSAQAEAGRLLVLSKGEHKLSLVDPDKGKVLAQMPSGPDPHEVIASADGAYAYISNYGGGTLSTITVVDLKAQKTITAIDLGALRGPHGLVFTGHKLWFTVEGSKAIGRYDPATQKVDWVMGTGQDRTHMLFVTPDLKNIYTTNVSSGTVTLLEQKQSRGFGPPPGSQGPNGPPPGGRAGTGGPPPGFGPRLDWEETVVPVGHGDEGFDITPDGKELWAANAMDGTISVIDLAAKKVIATLQANVPGANRLKFTVDGKKVLVSMLSGPDVAVLDAGTREVVQHIKVGTGAAGIQMDPSGARAFVACTPDSYVAVIDLQSMTVSGRIQAGTEPDGLAWLAGR